MVKFTGNAQLRRSSGDLGEVYVVVTAANDIVNRLVDTTFKSAVQRAPRSGFTLRADDHKSLRHGTHYREYAKGANGRGAVGNKAPHARVVHDGRGPIDKRGTKKPMKWVNVAGPHVGGWRRYYVGGAAAQPWLVDAYNAARRIQDLENVKPMTFRPRRR